VISGSPTSGDPIGAAALVVVAAVVVPPVVVVPPDSSDIDNALVAKLGADTALLALMTNGVYVDEAPDGSIRHVIVSLVIETDVATFDQGRAIEDALYLVKAVALSTHNGVALGPTVMKAAAARIDALLEDGTLSIAGYELMTMHREERVRQTEVDDVDPSIRWFHRGGRYRVQVARS
jgi:hypothetical protein